MLIDWRWGERYFAEKLLDFDLASNSGGWQWAAGSGPDASPYFRIFNPTAQSQKFDATGAYIRRWVPELASLPDRHLHAPWEAPEAVLAAADVNLGDHYPAPMVDHKEARAAALDAYDVLSSAIINMERGLLCFFLAISPRTNFTIVPFWVII